MPRPRNTPERLWAKVDKRGPDECWVWMGWRNAQGYGRFEIDGKSYYAHRAIYLLANLGSIELNAPPVNGYGFLRHTCDNPPCCNPFHLLVGSHADNMKDKVARGRSRWFDSSAQSPRAKLTESDVRAIRAYHKGRVGPLSKLESMYGVSRATIHGVVYGRHYIDVT